MNTEMVVNGDFSNGSTGWTLYNGAVVENGMLKGVATAAPNIETQFAQKNIKVLPNNTYRLQARLVGRIDSPNTPFVYIFYQDVLNYAAVNGEPYIIPTTNDQIVTYTFTTPANAYYASIRLRTKGTCTAYFDDISIKLVN